MAPGHLLALLVVVNALAICLLLRWPLHRHLAALALAICVWSAWSAFWLSRAPAAAELEGGGVGARDALRQLLVGAGPLSPAAAKLRTKSISVKLHGRHLSDVSPAAVEELRASVRAALSLSRNGGRKLEMGPGGARIAVGEGCVHMVVRYEVDANAEGMAPADVIHSIVTNLPATWQQGEVTGHMPDEGHFAVPDVSAVVGGEAPVQWTGQPAIPPPSIIAIEPVCLVAGQRGILRVRVCNVGDADRLVTVFGDQVVETEVVDQGSAEVGVATVAVTPPSQGLMEMLVVRDAEVGPDGLPGATGSAAVPVLVLEDARAVEEVLSMKDASDEEEAEAASTGGGTEGFRLNCGLVCSGTPEELEVLDLEERDKWQAVAVSVLRFACAHGKTRLVAALLRRFELARVEVPTEDLLSTATYSSSPEMVAHFTAPPWGLDPTELDSSGITPLHIAALIDPAACAGGEDAGGGEGGGGEITDSLPGGGAAAVLTLLGEDPRVAAGLFRAEDAAGLTPYNYAVRAGRAANVEYMRARARALGISYEGDEAGLAAVPASEEPAPPLPIATSLAAQDALAAPPSPVVRAPPPPVGHGLSKVTLRFADGEVEAGYGDFARAGAARADAAGLARWTAALAAHLLAASSCAAAAHAPRADGAGSWWRDGGLPMVIFSLAAVCYPIAFRACSTYEGYVRWRSPAIAISRVLFAFVAGQLAAAAVSSPWEARGAEFWAWAVTGAVAAAAPAVGVQPGGFAAHVGSELAAVAAAGAGCALAAAPGTAAAGAAAATLSLALVAATSGFCYVTEREARGAFAAAFSSGGLKQD